MKRVTTMWTEYRMIRPVRAVELALALLLLLLLSACETDRSGNVPEEGAVKVYCLTAPAADRPDVRVLSHEWLSLPEEAEETLDQCQRVLEAMSVPRREGNISALSGEIEPVCTISGMQARVEVGPDYQNLTSLDQSLIAAAISLSLLELEGVRYVTITSAGVEQRLPGNYISESSIIITDEVFKST